MASRVQVALAVVGACAVVALAGLHFLGQGSRCFMQVNDHPYASWRDDGLYGRLRPNVGDDGLRVDMGGASARFPASGTEPFLLHDRALSERWHGDYGLQNVAWTGRDLEVSMRRPDVTETARDGVGRDAENVTVFLIPKGGHPDWGGFLDGAASLNATERSAMDDAFRMALEKAVSERKAAARWTGTLPLQLDALYSSLPAPDVRFDEATSGNWSFRFAIGTLALSPLPGHAGGGLRVVQQEPDTVFVDWPAGDGPSSRSDFEADVAAIYATFSLPTPDLSTASFYGSC